MKEFEKIAADAMKKAEKVKADEDGLCEGLAHIASEFTKRHRLAKQVAYERRKKTMSGK